VANQIGSTDSNIVTSLVADIPQTPTDAPGYLATETNTTSIRVLMTKVVMGGDGGTPITSYQL